MQYDWSGVRTRRIARAKMAACVIITMVAVSAPILALKEGSLSVPWLMSARG
ncbi:hypothetical protein HNQ75_004328 [Rhizobium flavum]|uniref:Uncharacterized protein n=1 Tax=Pseudorhizobium flavum TaxID=1335061 RepID=A0A7W9Z2J5_9HYPH|nr:hypothetical protein [Pseudorhizobium flavum]CAD6632065.1 hypothetical protein RFYW14_04597 [Pseudorhizobium flavum]